jgi:hypothetical protein
MNLLTTAEMRDVGRRTLEMGIPGVAEFLAEHCAPLAGQRLSMVGRRI